MASQNELVETRVPGNPQGILLVSVGILAVMAVVLLAPAVPGMMHHFAGIPGSQQLVVFSLTCPALCVALLSPFIGLIIDRFGRRKFLIGSLIAYPLFGTAPLYLNSLHAIILSRLGVGVAEAVLLSSSMTMLGDFFSDMEREKFVAINTGIASLSAAVFFAIGGILAATDWRLPYTVYGIGIFFLLAVLAFTWEPPRRSPNQERAASSGTSVSFPIFRVVAICLVAVIGGIIFMVPQIEIGPISIAHGHLSPATSGMIGSLGSIAMPVGAFIFNRLRKLHCPVPGLIIAAFIFCGAGLFIMGAFTPVVWLAIGMIIHEFGCGFLLTGLMTWVLGLLNYDYRGKGTSAYFTAWFASQPLAGFLFGWVQYNMSGNIIYSFYVFGSVAIVMALILTLVQISFVSRKLQMT